MWVSWGEFHEVVVGSSCYPHAVVVSVAPGSHEVTIEYLILSGTFCKVGGQNTTKLCFNLQSNVSFLTSWL